MIQTSPETLPVTLPETIPKTNQTTEIAHLSENKIILGVIINEIKMLAAVLAGTMVMSLGTNLCWADGEKTKVTMTVWNGEWGDQLDRTMESFNSKHDDIELDITMQSGDYSDFLGTAAATNDWPDIYILTPWTQVQDFAEAGRLLDLSGMDFTEKVYPVSYTHLTLPTIA